MNMDLKKFCEYWLMCDLDWYIGGEGAYFSEVIYECPEQMLLQSVSPSIYSMGSRLAPAPVAGEMELEMMTESISEPVDVNSILNWLDDVWANDAVVRESMTESEYLEFRNSIESAE